jgi:hypothetical protein
MNRLNEVEIRNFKKIRRAHLVLDGNTLTITGDNEAGKSSFLDGIVALFAGKDAAPKTPIRKGAKEAVVLGYLTDNEGRKLKATLTFGLPNSRRIVVVDVETGKPIASPQALLDTFWDKTSFDPSLFLVSKEADQLAMLRKMAGLDFAASDAEHARIFAERTVVNREVDRLRGVLSSPRSRLIENTTMKSLRSGRRLRTRATRLPMRRRSTRICSLPELASGIRFANWRPSSPPIKRLPKCRRAPFQTPERSSPTHPSFPMWPR